MASSYFESAPFRIFNSNLISTFVSVGLHGLALFLLVPYVANLPTSESEGTDKEPINVSVIELNPSEQSRLPDQNAGLSSMPEFPNSSLGDLPVLDSPSLGSSLPNNFNNLPSPPALPPLPPLPSYNNYSRLPIELPPQRSFPRPPSPISRIPLPPPSLQTPTLKKPPVPDLENRETPDLRQNIDFGDPTPVKPNNPLFQGDRPNPQNPLATNPSLPPSPNRDINRQGENTRNLDGIVRNIMNNPLPAKDNLIYKEQGTKPEDATLRDVEWMQQTGVTLKPSQMMTIKAAYPKAACSRKLEVSAIYNVLVNDNGQLRKPPFMTQSSGYSLFNNLGLQAVRSRSFPKSTRVKVIFQYDPKICGSGVVEGQRNNQPQVSPSSQPKTPTQPNSAPQVEQNQTPKAPPEPKNPASTPENSTDSTPKTPTESQQPQTQPNPTPQVEQNQTPKAPPEPKSPAPTPENSDHSTPKTPTESQQPQTQPNPTPQVEQQNQTPSAPPEPKSPAPTPENSTDSTPKASPEEKKTPNPPSNIKSEGVAAPPAGRK
ncbi:MAG: energy transducer TonB [Crocosphaera sp.]|nr:energy transducer TonB [Crocosphaera sp.]